MILSMTGYGEASRKFNDKTYRIEIKSLNGKTTDVRFKSNTTLKEKEIELRKIIQGKGIRGKFDVNLNIESASASEGNAINLPLMESYFKTLKAFADEHGIEKGDMIQSIIRLPNIVQLEESLEDESWHIVEEVALEAIEKLNAFRIHEGQSIETDIIQKIDTISALLVKVEPYESSRIIALKERIMKNLKMYLSKENIDENRFEQEVMYYLEKLDINEEKVRLAQHCMHFKEAVLSDEMEKGKKLSFMSQEVGREVNTLGAKAQHSEIQQIVVNMKDELEKIKEQVLNIL